MQDKRCSECSHSLETPTEGEIICIAHPPSCVVVDGRVNNIFPVMMEWGKCDEFIEGVTQKENSKDIKFTKIKKPKLIRAKTNKKKEM